MPISPRMLKQRKYLRDRNKPALEIVEPVEDEKPKSKKVEAKGKLDKIKKGLEKKKTNHWVVFGKKK